MDATTESTGLNERHDRIRTQMEELFLFQFGEDAGETDNLFEAGLMDSFGFVSLISYLEDTFGLKFTEEEMIAPEWSSLEGICGLVDAKLAGR